MFSRRRKETGFFFVCLFVFFFLKTEMIHLPRFLVDWKFKKPLGLWAGSRAGRQAE